MFLPALECIDDNVPWSQPQTYELNSGEICNYHNSENIKIIRQDKWAQRLISISLGWYSTFILPKGSKMFLGAGGC